MKQFYEIKNASAGNRTRVDSLEGYNSTSKLLMLLTSLVITNLNPASHLSKLFINSMYSMYSQYKLLQSWDKFIFYDRIYHS